MIWLISFPVWIDLGDSFGQGDLPNLKLELSGSPVNFVELLEAPARLTGDNYRSYLNDVGFARSIRNAVTRKAESGTYLRAEFVQRVLDGYEILLLEGRASSRTPLRVNVYLGTDLVHTAEIHLRLVGVEDMYRHASFLYLEDVPNARAPSNANPVGYPDSQTNGKNFVFVHGFNVTPRAARGWNAEMFKRMY